MTPGPLAANLSRVTEAPDRSPDGIGSLPRREGDTREGPSMTETVRPGEGTNAGSSGSICQNEQGGGPGSNFNEQAQTGAGGAGGSGSIFQNEQGGGPGSNFNEQAQTGAGGAGG